MGSDRPTEPTRVTAQRSIETDINFGTRIYQIKKADG